MEKVNSLLTQRLKKASETLSKMTSLAELSSSGNLTSFSGVFRVTPLAEGEKEMLRNLLAAFSFEEQEPSAEDLTALSGITSEVKAINNQAIILHGERIKKAQEILKNYKEGAFTAWLITAYGNRQTPYNFLQYYELHRQLSRDLQPKLEEMPRQALYTLASRSGPFEDKEQIIRNYVGQTKQELLSLIRNTFPLQEEDRRKQNLPNNSITSLARLLKQFQDPDFRPNPKQKKALSDLLHSLLALVQIGG